MAGRCLGKPALVATRAGSRLRKGITGLVAFPFLAFLAFAFALAFAFLALAAWASARPTLKVGSSGIGLFRGTGIPQRLALAEPLFFKHVAIEPFLGCQGIVRLVLFEASVFGPFAVL